MINTTMIKTADQFFDNINYTSIIDTVKGIYTSDGSINILLDYERVLDSADLYAFENWDSGELVQGPTVKKYSVSCVFMYPYKLMPNPKGAKRLVALGCDLKFKKTKMLVPVAVENPEDYMAGTHYPKSQERKIWLVYINVPKELMEEMRKGSIDLAGEEIDLDDINDSYNEDLDKEDTTDEEIQDTDNQELGL